MAKQFNIIEVVEASAISSNNIFPKNTIITFYNNSSKFKIADGKTAFNDLSPFSGSGVPPDVQAALDTKVDKTTTVAGKALSSNVTLVKADVGLGSVDNTSDLAKPISTATQTALNAKQDTLVSGTNIKTVNGTTLLGSSDLSTNVFTGWATYTDNVYTVGSPFSILAGVTSTLPNNAATVINTQLPTGVSSFYNSGTNKITPQNDGDYYIFAVRFKAKTSVANGGYLDFGIDIGGAMGIVFPETKPFLKGAATEQSFSITCGGYTAATFLANGGLVKITAGNGDLSIYDISYQISRIHKAK